MTVSDGVSASRKWGEEGGAGSPPLNLPLSKGLLAYWLSWLSVAVIKEASHEAHVGCMPA